MNIKISAVHFKADQKLEDFITEKLEKLDKLHDGIIGSDFFGYSTAIATDNW